MDGVNGRLHRIRLRYSLASVEAQQSNYVKRRLSNKVLACIDRLSRLTKVLFMEEAINEAMFPTTHELIELERLYGVVLSNRDQSGHDDQIIIDGQAQDLVSDGISAEEVLKNAVEQSDEAKLLEELESQKRALEELGREEEVEYVDQSTDLTALLNRDVKIVGSLPSVEELAALPPAKVVCPSVPGNKVWVHVKAIQKCILILLEDRPVPTGILSYIAQGELLPGTLPNSYRSRKGYGPLFALKLYTFEEAASALHKRTTANPSYVALKEAQRKRLEFPAYRREQHKIHKWNERIHQKAVKHKLKMTREGPAGYDDDDTSSESDKDYDGHSDTVGLVEPPRFPPVQTDFREVNKLKHVGTKATPRDRVDYDPLGGDSPPKILTKEDREVLKKKAKEWEQAQRAFRNMRSSTAAEDNRHLKKPSEQRIDDLKEKWTQPSWPFGSKEKNSGFKLYNRPPDLPHAETVFLDNEPHEVQRKIDETQKWHKSVVVNDTHFHVKMTHNQGHDAIDKYLRGMLKDPPMKESLKRTKAHEPCPVSMYNAPPLPPSPPSMRTTQRAAKLGPEFYILKEGRDGFFRRPQHSAVTPDTQRRVPWAKQAMNMSI